MTKQAAELLNQYGGEINEEYSGKGMYGKTTTGIIFNDDEDFFTALANAFSDCIVDNDEESGEHLVKMLKSIKTDSMGKEVIYY